MTKEDTTTKTINNRYVPTTQLTGYTIGLWYSPKDSYIDDLDNNTQNRPEA